VDIITRQQFVVSDALARKFLQKDQIIDQKGIPYSEKPSVFSTQP
jgi:hypothetical protein